MEKIIDYKKYNDDYIIMMANELIRLSGDLKKEKNLYKLVNEMGFIIKIDTLEDRILAKLKINNEKVLILNDLYSSYTKRYAIAYLLGQYILEYKGENIFEIEKNVYNDEKFKSIKYELFACSLLMPEDEFYKIFDKLNKSYSIDQVLDKMEKTFKVPYNMIQYYYEYLEDKYSKDIIKAPIIKIKKYR